MGKCFLLLAELAVGIHILASGIATASTSADDFFHAIRANDLARLRKLTADPSTARVKWRLDFTPLHYAATYGSTESVKILLDAGADPNARNNVDATPLIFAAWSLDRTRLLVDKGADVNAHARNGYTPLMIAASVSGNAATLRYLLDNGATVNALTPFGSDALMIAAEKGDSETVRLILTHGGDAHRADQSNFNALSNAFSVGDIEKVQLLLHAGSDVNLADTFAGRVKHGPISLVGLTPLLVAVPYSAPESIAALLNAGSKVNAVDCRKMSPLMLAVASDHADPAVVRKLIVAGANINAKDQNDESVWDWAAKFRQPEILEALETAGAKPNVGPRAVPVPSSDSSPVSVYQAVARASQLLQKSGAQFFPEGGGCAGCHHQPLGARAFAATRSAALPADERLQRVFDDSILAVRPRAETSMPFLYALGGDYDELLYQTVAMADLGQPANGLTDLYVQYLAARQSPSGAWLKLGAARPPLQDSTISRTTYAVQTLNAYSWPARNIEFRQRIARARDWLLASKPVTTYEAADRLLGLHVAGVQNAALLKDSRALLAAQKSDGGWAQTPYLETDAYATGLVLHNLYQAGLLKPDEPAYRRGVQFLLRTQFPDGSWYVRSRSPKFQPYFQSGFPFDHDQWISAAGTAWAVMALAPAAQTERKYVAIAR